MAIVTLNDRDAAKETYAKSGKSQVRSAEDAATDDHGDESDEESP